MTRFQPQGSRITYNQAAPGQTPFKQLYGMSRVWASLDPLDKVKIKKLLGLASNTELLKLDNKNRREVAAGKELERRAEGGDVSAEDIAEDKAWSDAMAEHDKWGNKALELLRPTAQTATETLDTLRAQAQPTETEPFYNRDRVHSKYAPALLNIPDIKMTWEDLTNG